MSNRVSENKYNQLYDTFYDFATDCCYRDKTDMGFFEKVNLGSCNLTTIYERTIAARQLGHDVILEAKEDGLYIKYIKKMPSFPTELEEIS